MSNPKKIISIDKKYHALTSIINKEKTPKQIMSELGVKHNTISDWIKKKDKITEYYFSPSIHSSAKRIRTAQHVDIDKALLKWYQELKASNVQVNGPMIMEKADEFAKMFNIDFECNSGWLHRFKKRHNIFWATSKDSTKTSTITITNIDNNNQLMLDKHETITAIPIINHQWQQHQVSSVTLTRPKILTNAEVENNIEDLRMWLLSRPDDTTHCLKLLKDLQDSAQPHMRASS
jgi:hypothetical protein